MNPLLDAFDSEPWSLFVKALLHTLWIGAAIAAALWLILRGTVNPTVRYRWCLAALAAVAASGILAWALLQPHAHQTTPILSASSNIISAANNVTPSTNVNFPTTPPATPWHWAPLLALVWLTGAILMLARSLWHVVEAECIRVAAKPLPDGPQWQLLETARRQLGLSRRVRILITEQLLSPAVMGIFTPTLLLPVSLVTSLPLEQLQFIFLHELAHVRRGDYLVNLAQLVIESILFFNPAVWWISRQIRQEREACCDALAVTLTGTRLEYARTLANVAATTLTVAPAFGGQRHPSSLKDRIQRLLTPGYRPILRPTWSTFLGAFLIGGALLIVSANGARATVEAILTARQRMDQIEQKTTALGLESNARKHGNLVTVTARVRTADDSPLPTRTVAVIHSESIQNGSSAWSSVAIPVSPDGSVNGLIIPMGTLQLEINAPGFAPLLSAASNVFNPTMIDLGKLVLTRGFPVTITVQDAVTGVPVVGAKLNVQFNPHDGGWYFQSAPSVTTDASGHAVLPHCADLPLSITPQAEGYQMVSQHFDHVLPGQSLTLRLTAGTITSGTVVDDDGHPIAGATLRLISEQHGNNTSCYDWNDESHELGKTDSHGHFSSQKLSLTRQYWLGVSAPNHARKTLEITPGDTAINIVLGPEIIVRGRVVGNLDGLRQADGNYVLKGTFATIIPHQTWTDVKNVPLTLNGDQATFIFTNPIAGTVAFYKSDAAKGREITAPLNDWVIHLDDNKKPSTNNLPTRLVIFRFSGYSDSPPRGTVKVSVPDDLNPAHLTAHDETITIAWNEAVTKIPVGGRTSIRPEQMPGYTFDPWTIGNGTGSLLVTNGESPMIITIPVIPAGAIFATAKNADDTPAHSTRFSVSEVKPSPHRNPSSTLPDSTLENSSGHWTSGSLPLDGVYQVYAWHGNSFCVSQKIKLTEAKPDAEVALQFAPGKTFTGRVLSPTGDALPNTELKVIFENKRHNASWQLDSVYTDTSGNFQIMDLTPDVGDYMVEINAPGAMAERFPLRFTSHPQTIQLHPGRSLAGRVVQAGAGLALPGVKINAVDRENLNPLTATVLTMTDKAGRFAFSNLGDADYTFYTDAGQVMTDATFPANGSTNLVLSVKLYPWNTVQPVK